MNNKEGIGKSKIMKNQIEKYLLGLPDKFIIPQCIKCGRGVNDMSHLNVLHNQYSNMHISCCDNCYKNYNTKIKLNKKEKIIDEEIVLIKKEYDLVGRDGSFDSMELD